MRPNCGTIVVLTYTIPKGALAVGLNLYFNDNIISEKCQAKLDRIAQRVEYKEKLYPSMEKVINRHKAHTTAKNLCERIQDCGKWLKIDAVTAEILKANFCKQRLCPVCNYISSVITYAKIIQAEEWIKQHVTSNYIFITLTIKNPNAEELPKMLDHLMKSLNRIQSRKTWKRVILGAIRGLEITYNPKEDTYHPHIHMLCAVPQNYFYKDNPDYITIDKLRKWWQQSARLDYHVQIDLSGVKSADEKEKAKAIAEIAKYSVKTAEILHVDSDEQQIHAMSTIYNCVYRRRLRATTGVWKTALKEIGADTDLEKWDPSTLEQTHPNMIELLYGERGASKWHMR